MMKDGLIINNICFNDGTNVHIKYWTIYSDSSNHETITRQSYSKSNDVDVD